MRWSLFEGVIFKTQRALLSVFSGSEEKCSLTSIEGEIIQLKFRVISSTNGLQVLLNLNCLIWTYNSDSRTLRCLFGDDARTVVCGVAVMRAALFTYLMTLSSVSTLVQLCRSTLILPKADILCTSIVASRADRLSFSSKSNPFNLSFRSEGGKSFKFLVFCAAVRVHNIRVSAVP